MPATADDVREVHTAAATFLRAHEDALRAAVADPARAGPVARAFADSLDGDLARVVGDLNDDLGVAASETPPDEDEVAAWVRGDERARLAWAAHALEAARHQAVAALTGLDDAYRRTAAGFADGAGLVELAPVLDRLHGSRQRVRASLAALRANLDAWAAAALVLLGEPAPASAAPPPPLEFLWQARARLAAFDVDGALAVAARALAAAGVHDLDDAVAAARAHPEGAWRLLDVVEARLHERA